MFAHQVQPLGRRVSFSEPTFDRMTELRSAPERVDELPYSGWLSTGLPLYEPTTLNLKTVVHSQPVGTVR